MDCEKKNREMRQYVSINNQNMNDNMTSTNYNSGYNEKQMIEELRNQNQYLQKQIEQRNMNNTM